MGIMLCSLSLSLSFRTMSSLYSDPQWSANIARAVSKLSGIHVVSPEKALAWLADREKEEHFSLSNIWGVITSAGIMNQVRLETGNNVSKKKQSLYSHVTILLWYCDISYIYDIQLDDQPLFHTTTLLTTTFCLFKTAYLQCCNLVMFGGSNLCFHVKKPNNAGS